MNKILVMDDDLEIHQILKTTLGKEFKLVLTENISNTKTEISRNPDIDLAIFDERLPDGSGIQFCSEITKTNNFPVIILTQKDELQDKLQGFQSGAQDYVTKPFEPLELVARVKARLNSKKDDLIKHEDVELDLISHKMYIISSGERVGSHLTPVEFQILKKLILKPGEVYNRDELFSGVWESTENMNSRSVDQHVSNLRKKIKNTTLKIKGVYGRGYVLDKKVSNKL